MMLPGRGSTWAEGVRGGYDAARKRLIILEVVQPGRWEGQVAHLT